jgi:hypothetical protein
MRPTGSRVSLPPGCQHRRLWPAPHKRRDRRDAVSVLKTVACRIGQVAASLIVLTHVEILGTAVAAASMFVGIFVYCWTISSENRSERVAEIIRAFRGLPKYSSPAVRPARKSASALTKGTRSARRRRR